MSRWFAAPAGLALDGGYFYLCPSCFEELILPRLDELLDVLREHHPAPRPAAHPDQPIPLSGAPAPADTAAEQPPSVPPLQE